MDCVHQAATTAQPQDKGAGPRLHPEGVSPELCWQEATIPQGTEPMRKSLPKNRERSALALPPTPPLNHQRCPSLRILPETLGALKSPAENLVGPHKSHMIAQLLLLSRFSRE